MMIVAASPDHFARLAVQEGQSEEAGLLSPAMAALACASPNEAWAALDGPRVLGVGGVQPVWAGRAMLWCYLAPAQGAAFVAVHRAVRRFLAGRAERRLEAVAVCGFAAAHRWLDMLGFDEPPALLRAYTPGGRDAVLRARVRA